MNNVQFIHDDIFARRAQRLVDDFYEKFPEESKKSSGNIDIIKIATKLLNFKIFFTDLKSAYGDKTLGMIDANKKVILCDISIEPHGCKAEINEKVLNFTVAHEIGHYVLHSRYMNIESPLFHTKLNKNEKARIEFQANRFASFILMPDKIFIDMFNYFTSSFKLENNSSINHCNMSLNKYLPNRLSEYFKVSNEAIFYKIRELKL
jgi:Zn-dependent peptidase ImmA (M78 family)